MEVHSHSYTPDPDSHRSRKKWTHYFWEFLMLFLAVFCGFLAEYLLEHKIAKERAGQYKTSLYEDLVSDTAMIDVFISRNSIIKERLNTFKGLLYEYKPVDSINTRLYELLAGIEQYYLFIPKERTIAQLKNSGDLRLITDKTIAGEIADYDNSLSQLKGVNTNMETWSTRSFYLAQEIFNLKYLKSYYNTPEFEMANWNDSVYVIDPVYRNKKLLLLDANPKLLIRYANSLTDMYSVTNGYIAHLHYFKAKEVTLLLQLKGKYHLK